MIERSLNALRFASRMEKRRRAAASEPEALARGVEIEAPQVDPELYALGLAEPETPIARTGSRRFLARLEAALEDDGETPAMAPEEHSDEDAGAESQLAAAREIAALCGRFDPAELLKLAGLVPSPAVLSRLAPVCEIQPDAAMSWRLKSGPRAAAIRTMMAARRLAERLAGPLPETDRAGGWIRKILSAGDAIDIHVLDHDAQATLAPALECLAEVSVPKPDLKKLNRLMASGRLLDEYDSVLADGFFGRETELTQLRNFFVYGGTANWSGWSGAVLTGAGGSGKSTLLAKAARDAIAGQVATVVVLDFDKPGVDPEDRYWMEMEIARQIAAQFPESGQVAALREAAREQKRLRDAFGDSSYGLESVDRSTSLVGELGNFLAQSPPVRPVVLVLDTFEEVAQRNLVGRLLEWLSEVASGLRVALSVLFSGRIYERSNEELKHFAAQVIEIGELQPDEALQLLERLGLDRGYASRLAYSTVLPRRPLELRLLAKLGRSENPPPVEELEQDFLHAGPYASELFAGLVNRRVLRRMKDNTAQTLAYPGLVLRYVTVPLLQQVLVPALGLDPLDDTAAKNALDSLASYEWLATRAADGAVWHRRDLRRSTLKAMIAKEPDTAKRIHHDAILYFLKEARDIEGPAYAEALYHQLMLAGAPGGGSNLDLDQLKRANTSFAADAGDLPAPAAALLRFAVTGSAAVQDIPLLPDCHIAKIYASTARGLHSSNEWGAAVKLYRELRPARVPGGLERWEVDVLYRSASWELLDAAAERPVTVTSGIRNLAEMVFPYAAVGMADSERNAAVAKTISFAASYKASPSPSGTGDPDALQSLAIALLLIFADRTPDAAASGALGSLVQELAPWAQNSGPLPLLRLAQLSLIAPGYFPKSALVAPVILRLDRLAEYSRIPGMAFAADIARSISVTQVTSLSAKNVLNAVDIHREQVTIPLEGADLRLLLQGPAPEFRDPCRYALLDAFPDAASYADLGAIFAAALPASLIKLDPVRFALEIAPDPEHLLISYVELLDRAGGLLAALRAASAARPGSGRLRRVFAAYERWTNALDAAIASKGPKL